MVFNSEIVISDLVGLFSRTEQFPNFGGLRRLKTDNILYIWRNVGVDGWSLLPPASLMVPKSLYINKKQANLEL